MSRLKVGDIEINGSRVTISSPGTSINPSRETGVAQRANRDLLKAAIRIRGGHRMWLVAGALVTATGTLINIALQAWQDPVTALIQGGLLAPLGVGIGAIGLAKWTLARHGSAWHLSALGADNGEYVAKIEHLLETHDSQSTISWLVSQTGWTEAVVVHSLAILRARGRIHEDLDIETGEYVYVLSDTSRDLNTRLQDLSFLNGA